jgi:hypothetical protein
MQFSADYLPHHIKLTQLKSLPTNPFNEGFDSVHKIAQKKCKMLIPKLCLIYSTLERILNISETVWNFSNIDITKH